MLATRSLAITCVRAMSLVGFIAVIALLLPITPPTHASLQTAADTTSADRLFRLGVAAYEKGTRKSVDSAKQHFLEAARRYTQEKNKQGAARVWSRLGALYLRIGRGDSALYYLHRALPIQRSIGDEVETAVTLKDLAHVNFELFLEDNARLDSIFYYARAAFKIAREVQNQKLETCGYV